MDTSGATSPRKTAAELEKDQKAHFDSKAFSTEFDTPFHLAEFGKYVPNEAKILDYGCGYGRTLSQLSAAGYADLSGLDTSAEMIQRAGSTLKIDLKVKKGRRAAYDAATFDSVVLLNVLSCVIPNTEQLRLIDDIKRILKPNGVLYVNDYLLDFDDDAGLLKYNQYKDAYKDADFDYEYGVFETPDGGLCRHHDPSWIKQLLADFKQEEHEAFTMTLKDGSVQQCFYWIGSLPELTPV